jgi:hypothetical protein
MNSDFINQHKQVETKNMRKPFLSNITTLFQRGTTSIKEKVKQK